MKRLKEVPTRTRTYTLSPKESILTSLSVTPVVIVTGELQVAALSVVVIN